MVCTAGVLVEPRLLYQVGLLIANFFKVLPECKLYFFCGVNLKSSYADEERKWGDRLIIIELSVANLNALTYSDLLKNIDFWANIDADYVLTIQTDGCLCTRSPYKLSHFTSRY